MSPSTSSYQHIQLQRLEQQVQPHQKHFLLKIRHQTL